MTTKRNLKMKTRMRKRKRGDDAGVQGVGSGAGGARRSPTLRASLWKGEQSGTTSNTLVAAIASHAGGGAGDGDSVADRVRLALCRFAESQGGAKSVSQIFVKLNEQSMGGGVTTLALVSDGLYCVCFQNSVCAHLLLAFVPRIDTHCCPESSSRCRSWNCWPPQGLGLHQRRPAIFSSGSAHSTAMMVMATTTMV